MKKVFILIITLLIASCVEYVGEGSINPCNEEVSKTDKIIINTPDDAYRSKMFIDIYKFVYEGHSYILMRDGKNLSYAVGGLIHDPNCNCFKN